MRWILSFPAILVFTAGATADEPYWEYVDRLRSAGLADLAEEYLDKLAAKNLPDLAVRLPLERAKTLVALAEEQDSDKKRDEKLNQARVAFDSFLRTNPVGHAAADTRFELARLLVRQGKFRVAVARRLESRSERQDTLARARVSFELAAQELKRAQAALQAELSTADEAAQTQLARKINEAKYELGLLTLHKALTYRDSSPEQLRLRNSDLLAAKKLFLTLAELDATDALSWRAYVEAGHCWMELDNKAEAKKVFSTIAKQANAAAADAARVARFYELQLVDKEQSNKKQSPDIIRNCDEWLTRYAKFARAPEGQGIQFLLATHLMQQAQLGIKPQLNGPTLIEASARQMLSRAERILKELSAADGEYSRRASTLRSEVLVLLIGERATGSIAALNDFDECFLTAQVDLFQSTKVKADDAEVKRQRHLRRAIQALERGITLVSRTDDPRDVFTARMMLSYVYLLSGDPYSAAVLGEHLTVTNLNSNKGVRAAVYALSAYATILGESKNRNASPDEIAADTRRLRRLADLVLTNSNWKDEPETDAARFQLGNLFFDSANYRDAYTMFAQIKESFPGYAQARYRQGAAAQWIQAKDAPFSPDEKRKILAEAIAALDKLPDPAAGVSTETVLATYQAKLQLGQLLMLLGEDAQNYDRVETIGVLLKSKLSDLLEKDDPAYAQLEIESERARVAGLTGKAYLLLKNGKYEEARRRLTTLMAEVSKSAGQWKNSPHVAEPWFLAYIQTVRDVVMLDARANILAGNLEDVKKDLQNIRSLTPDDKQQDAYAVMLRLVLDLKTDLDAFKKANDANHQRKLEAGLVGLLDEMTRPKDLAADVRVFLAQGYSAIDRHDKAAALLAGVPPAKAEDEAGTRTYRFARLNLARALRLNKKYYEAKSVLREIMGTPAQKGWGYDNFDVRREAIAVLEDEGNYAGAVKMAVDEQNKLIKAAQEFTAKNALVLKLRDEAKSNAADAAKLNEQANLAETDAQKLQPLRERFFEFYSCELNAIVKNAQKNNDSKSADALARVANRLVKLEQGQPDLGGDANRERFRELLEGEPALREKYVSAGGRVLTAKPKN